MASPNFCLIFAALLLLQITFLDGLALRQLPSTSLAEGNSLAGGATTTANLVTSTTDGTIKATGATTLQGSTNVAVSQLMQALQGITGVIDTFQHYTANSSRYLERLRHSAQLLSDTVMEIGTDIASTVSNGINNRLNNRQRPAAASVSSSSANAATGSRSVMDWSTFLTTRQLATDEGGSAVDQIHHGQNKESTDGVANLEELWFNLWANSFVPGLYLRHGDNGKSSDFSDAVENTLSRSSTLPGDVIQKNVNSVQETLTNAANPTDVSANNVTGSLEKKT